MNRRILLVDDNENVLKDYMKILNVEDGGDQGLDEMEMLLLGGVESESAVEGYETFVATQGQKALELVQDSVDRGEPFAMAFMDVRMPPGWDGVETTCKIWDVDPDLFVVICTAFSDHSWEDMTQMLGNSDRFLILKKPFDVVEVQQLAAALIKMKEIDDNLKNTLSDLKESNTNLRLAECVKSQFLSNMNHELRTPLTAISGFSQILEASAEDEEQKEAISFIRKNVERLNRFVEDILDATAVKSGSINPKIKPFQGKDVFPLLLEQYEEIAKEAGLSFSFEGVEKLPEIIETDSVMARQAVGNILENAVKYTEEGGVKVSFSSLDKEGVEYAQIEISDTGSGVEKSKLDLIFDPFYQVDGGLSREHEGGGLGLTISKKLCESLGGDVQVRINDSGGCTFTVTLLAVHQEEELSDMEKRLREIMEENA